MLKVYTGENRLLVDALVRRAGAALAEDEAAVYVVVPRQLTLLTERLLLSGLKKQGSFRLRVLSPARLCTLIFEAVGFPQGVRVDERGRVMLVRRAIQLSDGLSVYRNADRRRGFADRCARQLELFMQGGVTPDMLRDCADESRGMTAMKLNDLATLMETYSSLIAGRYQDGETELIEAARRVEHADFVRSARFCFFGFDLMPPTLVDLIARLSALAAGAELFFPLNNDHLARDYDCCRPLQRALGRIARACADAGTTLERVPVEDKAPLNQLSLLAREMYAYPAEPQAYAPQNIRVTLCQDVREECMLAAATARRLAISGVRYGEMQIICADIAGMRQSLAEAFRIYGVPLFLSESRPVSRMATAECLLSALRMIERGFRSEDVFTLMRTGYMDLTDDETDRLANYAVKRGVDGTRWLRPFSRGGEEEVEALEPLRRRLIEPVAKLRSNLRAAESLSAQLTALFGFMTDIGAYKRSLDMQKRLAEQGMREAAGSLAQAWNRIVGALDQMAALMGDKRLSLRELTHTLTEALEAATIKALPQSGDAVYAQGGSRMLMQKCRALFVLGLSDRAAAGEEGLLTAGQKALLTEKTRAYLGPDESDSVRIRRFCLKASLGMATERVYFSCALSGLDGSAQRPGTEIELVRQIFPALTIGGGVRGDERMDRLLACAPQAALARSSQSGVATTLRAAREQLPDVAARLDRLEALRTGYPDRDGVDPASARQLYGRLQYQSITRLERFAGCPFSYFVAYGLRPERIEPFQLDRRDTGTFLHEAVNEFLRSYGASLASLSPDEAEQSMDAIARRMLDNMHTGTPMEDSAAARGEERAMHAAACRCARVLTQHMQGSSFTPTQLERSFGREDGAARLRAGDTILEGRIDRVDEWREGNSLRVIDFKLGGKPLNLAGAYHGLQLQLPIYLGAALRQRNARSAGVYYFPLEEGVVNTQSTNPVEVERERAKAFRMSGLLPEDMKLILAQTPDPEQVFQARLTAGGSLYSSTPCADDVNFQRLVNHCVKMAQQQIEDIRSGITAVSPAEFDRAIACARCDYHAACLFDPKLDRSKLRRLKNLKWDEVFERLALEENQQPNQQKTNE